MWGSSWRFAFAGLSYGFLHGLGRIPHVFTCICSSIPCVVVRAALPGGFSSIESIRRSRLLARDARPFHFRSLPCSGNRHPSGRTSYLNLFFRHPAVSLWSEYHIALSDVKLMHLHEIVALLSVNPGLVSFPMSRHAAHHSIPDHYPSRKASVPSSSSSVWSANSTHPAVSTGAHVIGHRRWKTGKKINRLQCVQLSSRSMSMLMSPLQHHSKDVWCSVTCS
jgi:hypothetical protein